MQEGEREILLQAVADLANGIDDGMILRLQGEMLDILARKGEDYSGHASTWQNFIVTGLAVKKPAPAIMIMLIGLKLGRLVSLVEDDRVPNFESIDDTCIDAANYCVLLAAWFRKMTKK